MGDDEHDRLTAEARRHAVQLMEHFDSVQIICTKHAPDGTATYRSGDGNWYARVASTEEFLRSARAQMVPPRED